MNSNLLHRTTSGLVALGAALGIASIDAIAPVDVLNPTTWGQRSPKMALAQNYDEETSVRVYEQASPAVVSIETRDGTGSGSIISPDGLVLTNAHVVGNARRVTVALSNGQRVQGEVVGFANDGLDLAAIRLSGQQNLPTIPIAASGTVRVGQRAFAIGNPFGQFQGTFTTGIVSRIDPDRGLIQTDAAINPGNSGGPLLNSRGELIGVNTSIYTIGQSTGNIGIGFAISTERIQPFLTAVREGRASRVASRNQASPISQGARSIAIDGPMVRGQLGQNSNILPADNSYFNVYTFEGRTGQQISIDMMSNEVDAYLILLTPDGQDLAQDDDGGDDTNARITATLPANGTYTVLANSYEPGEIGNYNLRLATLNSNSPRSTPNPNPTPRTQPGLLMDEAGLLRPGGPVLQDGSLYQEHTLEGRANQSVTIRLESEEFDPYLMLIDPSGEVLAFNDDITEADLNAEIVVTLPTTGTYRIIANAYDAAGQGRYRLTVR